jgi:hypothetical protein
MTKLCGLLASIPSLGILSGTPGKQQRLAEIPDRAPSSRLAATAFADEPQRFAGTKS